MNTNGAPTLTAAELEIMVAARNIALALESRLRNHAHQADAVSSMYVAAKANTLADAIAGLLIAAEVYLSSPWKANDLMHPPVGDEVPA